MLKDTWGVLFKYNTNKENERKKKFRRNSSGTENLQTTVIYLKLFFLCLIS